MSVFPFLFPHHLKNFYIQNTQKQDTIYDERIYLNYSETKAKYGLHKEWATTESMGDNLRAS